MGVFDLIKKIPTGSEIKGSFGEWLAKIYLKTYPRALILNDVLIKGKDDYTSQIDLVMVGNRGIYVFEVKLYSEATIYGDLSKSKWTYYNHGKKYEIYSPVKQNKKHVEYMKEFLKDFGELPVFSVVVMICKDFKLSGKKEDNTYICSSLLALDKAMFKIAQNNPRTISDEKKEEIFNHIKDNQLIGKEARFEHKQNVKE